MDKDAEDYEELRKWLLGNPNPLGDAAAPEGEFEKYDSIQTSIFLKDALGPQNSFWQRQVNIAKFKIARLLNRF